MDASILDAAFLERRTHDTCGGAHPGPPLMAVFQIVTALLRFDLSMSRL